jgi:hypothetical protein
VFLGLGLGAENNMSAYLISRYFGFLNFGEILGYIAAVSALGRSAGPWLMALDYDLRHSYNFALGAFGLCLLVSVLLLCRLGPYRYGPLRDFSEESGAVSLTSV